MKRIFLSLALAAMVFVSCSQNEENSVVPAAEAGIKVSSVAGNEIDGYDKIDLPSPDPKNPFAGGYIVVKRCSEATSQFPMIDYQSGDSYYRRYGIDSNGTVWKYVQVVTDAGKSKLCCPEKTTLTGCP